MKHTILIKQYLRDTILTFLGYLFRIFPLQDKVVAVSFAGKRYADNPMYIVEKILKINPKIKISWLWDSKYKMNVPEKINLVNKRNLFKVLYEYSTAKVLVTMTGFPMFIRKRKGQIVINTWHGGLGIKKIGDDDRRENEKTAYEKSYMAFNSKLADVFISNSNHLSKIYRSAFNYKGPIWKCGYPKNDIFLLKDSSTKKNVKKELGLDFDKKIALYAPTFRSMKNKGDIDFSCYNVDYKRLYNALVKKWSGDWIILVKYHPNMQHRIPLESSEEKYIKNVTSFSNMQDLILSSDCLLSDYSSCLFDAALAEIPIFTYATDFEEYKADRGVYYEMEELPFPYAKNNDELENNILNYDFLNYKSKWEKFKKNVGLFESGHASDDIANMVQKFITTGRTDLINSDV